MRDSVHVLGSIVIMRHCFRDELNMIKIIQSTFFPHLSQDPLLHFFSIFDPAREQHKPASFAFFGNGKETGYRIKHYGAPAVTSFFVVPHDSKLANLRISHTSDSVSRSNIRVILNYKAQSLVTSVDNYKVRAV